MNKLYISIKQLAFLILPFVAVLYLYSNPKVSSQMIASAETVVFGDLFKIKDYTKDIEESYSKKYYKDFETIKYNLDNSDKSLFQIDSYSSSWLIAYYYKQLPYLKESLGKTGKGNLGKLAELQDMVAKRNEDIASNLGMDSTKEELALIRELIKLRNLKKIYVAEEMMPIDLKRYNLQMVLWSSKSPTVIINNKIYKRYQNIDKHTKIKNIKQEKVLLQNQKEEKWLHLNN